MTKWMVLFIGFWPTMGFPAMYRVGNLQHQIGDDAVAGQGLPVISRSRLINDSLLWPRKRCGVPVERTPVEVSLAGDALRAEKRAVFICGPVTR